MILCAGEALIDMLPRKSAEGEDAFAPHAGGAVFNTAIALGRLGAGVTFFSGISSDLFGEILISRLAESGVGTDLAMRSDRPTTLAFVRLVNGQASYAFYDEGTAGRMLTVEDLPDLPADVSAAFFGGISLVVEPCAEAYAALMLREAGRRVTMIDPNVRPGFIRDEAAYRARIDSLLGAADIIKVSDEDLHWLEGTGDSAVLARRLLDRGAKLVCITEGARGATGHFAGGSVFVESHRATVVDTVGAGDTFNAGVLAALDKRGRLTRAAIADLSEDDVRAALSLGVAAAAVTVSRAGANPPWANEL